MHLYSGRRCSIPHTCFDHSTLLAVWKNRRVCNGTARTTGMRCLSSSWLLVFHGIQGHVRSVQQGPNGIGILRITGNPHADGKRWDLGIFRHKIANSPCYQCSGGCTRLWQDQSELVPAMARCGVDSAAAVPQDLPESAERSIPRQMTKLVVRLFQAIEVQQYQGE